MRLNNLLSIIAIFAAFVNALSYPEILYGNPRLQARDKVTVPSDQLKELQYEMVMLQLPMILVLLS